MSRQEPTSLYYPPPAVIRAKPSGFTAPLSRIYHGILQAGGTDQERLLSKWHVRLRFGDRPAPPAGLRIIRFRASGHGDGFAYYEIMPATLQEATNKEWTFQARGPYYFPPVQYDTILKNDVYGYQAFFNGEKSSQDVEAFVLPSSTKVQGAVRTNTRRLPTGLLAWTNTTSARVQDQKQKCTPDSLAGRQLAGFYTRDAQSTKPIRHIMKQPMPLELDRSHNFLPVDLANLAGASSQTNLWKTGRMDDRFEMLNTWYRKPGCNAWVEVTHMYCRGV